MKVEMVTTDILKEINVDKSLIHFIENNELIGFPINRLQDIKGNSKFINIVKTLQQIEYEVDNNGNITHLINNESKYEKMV